MELTNSLIKLCIMVTACLLNPAVLDAQTVATAPVTLDKANLGRIGRLQTESGQHVGTCFYCDERGYVTTCLSNVLDCKESPTSCLMPRHACEWPGRGRLARIGYRVLQLLDIPKDDARFRQALELRGDYVPKLEDRLLAWPSAEGLTYTADNFSKFVAHLARRRILSGYQSLGRIAYGLSSGHLLVLVEQAMSADQSRCTGIQLPWSCRGHDVARSISSTANLFGFAHPACIGCHPQG